MITPSRARRDGREAYCQGAEPWQMCPYKEGSTTRKWRYGDYLEGWMEEKLRQESEVDCKWCDTRTNNTGTRMCNSCWELHHRIVMNPELAKRIMEEVCSE